MFVSHRKDAFLGPRPLLIAARPAEDDVVAAAVESLLQRFGAHSGRVGLAMVERVQASRAARLVGVDDKFKAVSLREEVAEGE